MTLGAPRTMTPQREAASYTWDLLRRTTVFLDILRERAENMLDHERNGVPPVLDFEYETVVDAMAFERPVNYSLLRVTRRGDVVAADCCCPGARPIVIIDPRAGHGPGIGGFKQDSEVGIALSRGHPTYFVSFGQEPCAGQTLADVLHALRRFVHAVQAWHPGPTPAVYGNCQGGWAAALLAATHEGLDGPVVMSGSPLSYWAGEAGVNPMRLAGGLLGGSWPARFASDLGDGRFDGAWLVANFESLDLGHSLWEKNYAVFADPEAERRRFLDFERWWSTFCFLSREEIVQIVDTLFVGNRLEQGKLRICESCEADLRAIRNPLVLFASSGDNITPPHQALSWIPEVYPTTASLRKSGQRIVYLINPEIGHLGIFASGQVARLEHRAIFDSLDAIERLRPGLYEMKIHPDAGKGGCRGPVHAVRFVPRDVKEIRRSYSREAFERARDVSEGNAALYEAFAAPWVRATANPLTAMALKWSHPMRTSRYLFSERINPWMAFARIAASAMRPDLDGSSSENRWMQMERTFSRVVALYLREIGQCRDAACERAFATLYDAAAQPSSPPQ